MDKQISETEKTSEEIYGIPEQPVPLCPLIDDAQGEIEACYKLMRRYDRADEDELRDIISGIDSNLSLLLGYGNSGKLEDIRQHIIALREWGQKWKELALEKIQENE